MVTSKASRREEAVAVGLGLLDFFSAGPKRSRRLEIPIRRRKGSRSRDALPR